MPMTDRADGVRADRDVDADLASMRPEIIASDPAIQVLPLPGPSA
jgi:hypothetical protein